MAPRKKSTKLPTTSTVVAAGRKSAPRKKTAVSPEERYRMIELASYFIAEKSGFTRDPAACWIEAEQQVDAQLGGKKKAKK